MVTLSAVNQFNLQPTSVWTAHSIFHSWICPFCLVLMDEFQVQDRHSFILLSSASYRQWKEHSKSRIFPTGSSMTLVWKRTKEGFVKSFLFVETVESEFVNMVQEYVSPVRVHKFSFEMVMAVSSLHYFFIKNLCWQFYHNILFSKNSCKPWRYLVVSFET